MGKSFWSQPSRYGTYEGPKGNPEQWRKSFDHTFENSQSVKSIISTSHYSILGLLPSATEQEVRKTYRSLIKQHHPDHGGDRNTFEKLTNAYNNILNKNHNIPVIIPTTTKREVHDDEEDLIIPQLLTSIDENQLDTFLNDNNYGAQEKKDGRHLTLQILNNEYIVRNKKGQRSESSEFKSDFQEINGNILIDGEIVNGTFWTWDILELNQNLRTQSYLSRHDILSSLHFGPNIKLVPLAIGTTAKYKLYESLKTSGKEGIVFKKLNGLFQPGKGEEQFKFKFYEECSVIVAPGRQGKFSIGMELFNSSNQKEFVGFCSCNQNPPIGSVVEIKYLYAYKNGCLIQPAYKGLRDDVDPEECTMSQLKYKSED
jgi:DnaJ domain/RNA ligase